MPQGFHFLTLTQRHEMRAAKAPITEPSASVVKKTTMSSTLRSPALMEPFLGFAAFGRRVCGIYTRCQGNHHSHR